MNTDVDTIDPADPDTVELFEPPQTRQPFSPGDVVRLVVGLTLVVVGTIIGWVARSTIEGIELDLVRLVASIPDPFADLSIGLAQLTTRVIPTVALIALLVRRRWRLVLVLVLAGWLADAVMGAVDVGLFNRNFGDLIESLERDRSGGVFTYPTSHSLASTTAVVTVAAAWSSRRWKRALWGVVAVVVVLRLMSITQPAFDVITALGVGLAVGSAVLLLFGSPSNEPRPDELVDALRAVGIRPRRIGRPERSGSALRYQVDDHDDRALEVSLRTPDERDADLLTRSYRRFRFADSEVDAGYRRIERRIEHEALVLALAERHAVRMPQFVTLGRTERGAAFVVTDACSDRAVSEADLRSPGFLAELWTLLRDLHDAGVAHRDLQLDSVGVSDDGHARFRAFDRAHVAPSSRERARDVAGLLAETATVIGSAEAVDAAVATLGPERVAPALRMLQPLAFPPATRRRMKEAGPILDQLRHHVSVATGEPDVELDRLERIRPRTLLIIGASTLAFYSLLPQLANLGDTVESFGEARPTWLVATAIASVLTYVFAAISFQGAVAQALPFAPTLRSQIASAFAGLVGPAGAGGFALNARFLQRNGLQSGEAAASVTVNAIGGFAVHFTLLVGFIAWSGRTGVGGLSLPTGSTILLALAVVLALVGLLLAVAPIRARVVRPLMGMLRTGLGQISAVFRRPARVLALFGGSAGISLSYVAAIAFAVQAFGGGIALAQIGTAYLAAVAIATLAPTPGGLGALEAALIAGLTGFGLASGPAVAAVLTFRLATFWLPILPGWLALVWMQRNDEI